MKKQEVLDGYDIVSIAELISKLANLIEEGHKNVYIETYTRYEGTSEKGEYQFIYKCGRLVTEGKD